MREYKVPRRKKKKNQFVKFIVNSFVIMIAIGCASVVALKLYTMMLPPIKNLESYKPNVVTQIYADDGEIIKTFTAYTSQKATIKQIPEAMKKAIIATEDKNFYSHEGYDLTGLARSVIVNLQSGRFVQGASTITQQLARLLFLNNEKTYNRKIKEFILASRIEKSVSKDKILEMYLNSVYLGSGAYGVAGAAKVYFNKALNELTLSECALIAGLPQAPSVYSPFNNLDKAIKRRNQVLNRMYKMHYITKAQFNQAKEEKVTLNPLPSIYVYNKAPYFVDYVMKELQKMGFSETEIIHGGYKIYTTLDSKAQDAANLAMINNLKAWGMTGVKNQAAVFSFSPTTGEIITYAGGKNYKETQYDRIAQSIRPPGSAFKPIVYAAAIEKGWGPNDILDDKPVTVGKWSPRNYGSKYRGPIPLYAGLMVSSNVMAVRLIQDVGVRSVITLSRALGISTPLEYDSTIALGSNGVKLYDLTVAYGAFANGGFRVSPYAIKRVETNRGKVIYQAQKTKAVKAVSYETAATMTAMMKTVVTGGTGRAANIGVPVAAKTGTTDDYRDAWFVGFTPDIVTGVWVGNDDNSVMRGMTGGTVPALIWRDVMKVATSKFGNSDFVYPEVEINYITLPKSMTVEEMKELEDRESKTIKDSILDVDFDMDLKLEFPKNLHMKFFNRDELSKDEILDDESNGAKSEKIVTPVLAPVAKSSIKPIENTLPTIQEEINSRETVQVEKNNERVEQPQNAPLPGVSGR